MQRLTARTGGAYACVMLAQAHVLRAAPTSLGIRDWSKGFKCSWMSLRAAALMVSLLVRRLLSSAASSCVDLCTPGGLNKRVYM